MAEDEPTPLRLSDLNGAVLTWEDSDGNEHSVTFDEN